MTDLPKVEVPNNLDVVNPAFASLKHSEDRWRLLSLTLGNSNMRVFAAILVSLFLPCWIFGNQPPPAWHTADRNVQFFKEKGFEFSVDDSMAQHYKKPTVEISILIPEHFTDSGVTNTFSSATILSDDLSTDLRTHEHEGKNRVILTISEVMTKKSKGVFYFRNNRKGVTHGSMYRLGLSQVLDDWRIERK